MAFRENYSYPTEEHIEGRQPDQLLMHIEALRAQEAVYISNLEVSTRKSDAYHTALTIGSIGKSVELFENVASWCLDVTPLEKAPDYSDEDILGQFATICRKT